MAEEIFQRLLKQDPKDIIKIHNYISKVYNDLEGKRNMSKYIYENMLEEKKEETTLRESLMQELKILEGGVMEETDEEIRDEIVLMRQIQELANELSGINEGLMIILSLIRRYHEGRPDYDDLSYNKGKLDFLSDLPKIEERVRQIEAKINELNEVHRKNMDDIGELESLEGKEKKGLKHLRSESRLALKLYDKMSSELDFLKGIVSKLKSHFNL